MFKKAEVIKSIKCRLCKQSVGISPGLDEMEEHWVHEHPDALEALRAKLDREENG